MKTTSNLTSSKGVFAEALGLATLTVCAEPTRAGWWWGEFQDGERAVFELERHCPERKGDKNLFARSKHHPIGVAVGILFMRRWAGPFKSKRAARAAISPNKKLNDDSGQPRSDTN